jgi:hypothetical protein
VSVDDDSRYTESARNRAHIRDYIAEVVADAVTADAVIMLESHRLDDDTRAIECKLHVHADDVPPRMLIDALRNCANQIEERIESDD